MKNATFTSDFAKNFKVSYRYAMGGTQTIRFSNGQEFNFDDRTYYTGRGTKYNASIRHDAVGVIEVSDKQVKAMKADMRASAKVRADYANQVKAEAKAVAIAKAEGRYDLVACDMGLKVMLSKEESQGRTFDAARLASTLHISVADAELLNSTGKTYVIATTTEGKTIELYHSDLSVNPLNIYVMDATPERVEQLASNRAEWVSAPYAGVVGQTTAHNHYAC